LGLYWHDFDGDVKIPHGDVKITLKHTMKEPRLNGPSTVEFFINDEKVGEMDITATVYALPIPVMRPSTSAAMKACP
jgi:hypothetical protein